MAPKPNAETAQARHDRTRVLIARMQAGDRVAGGDILRAYEGFVRLVARPFVRTFRNSISADDIMQEGRIGLLEAARRFDLRRDTDLMSYARSWIWWHIDRFCDTNYQAVTIAHHASRDVRAAHATGVPASEFAKRGNSCLDAWLANASYESLDAPIADDAGEQKSSLHERVANPEITTSESSERRSLREALDRAMGHLTQEEAIMIRKRFFEVDDSTLKSVGASMRGVSRQRAYQIECGVMTKLRKALRYSSDRIDVEAELRE